MHAMVSMAVFPLAMLPKTANSPTQTLPLPEDDNKHKHNNDINNNNRKRNHKQPNRRGTFPIQLSRHDPAGGGFC